MNQLDFVTFMTNVQISFGIATIALLFGIFVLHTLSKSRKK